MLDEDKCITYAIRKDQIVRSGIREIREVPRNEEPACYVQEVGYILPFGDGKAVDPLSLTLMLTEEDLADPRVERCRNEMLEELHAVFLEEFEVTEAELKSLRIRGVKPVDIKETLKSIYG